MTKLNEVQVSKAVAALTQYLEKQEASGASSDEPFEKENRFWLQVGFKKTPAKQAKPVQLTIPHTLFVQNQVDICLFTKDPQDNFDKLAEEANIEGLKKVISAQTLRTNYKTYEAKRNLCDSYDLFLADARILPSLTKHLGSKFFQNKKQPMPIKFKDDVTSLTKAVDKSKQATFIRYNGGPCSSIHIGHGDLSSEQITANAVAALRALGDKTMGGWKNIQSAHLKTDDSIALPIYQSLEVIQAAPSDDELKAAVGTSQKLKRSDSDVAAKPKKRRKSEGKGSTSGEAKGTVTKDKSNKERPNTRSRASK